MTIFADSMPTDPLMQPAWLGCLHWAIGEPEIVAAFRAETGHQWRPAGGLAGMIDAATGADRAFLEAFARWMTVNIWGEEDA